jgi:hypothetical protein
MVKPKDLIAKMLKRPLGRVDTVLPDIGIGPFSHKGPRPDDGQEPSQLESLFWENKGVIVHKWHHYLPIYERYFQPWRNRPLRMLEIGVSKGGSLAMWRQYFGPEAVIFGIDIDPSCAKLDGQNGQVRIGSQADPVFLRKVVAEMGGIDIVLDDGSHVGEHMNASLDFLFPLLSEGGIYLVEDLHTSYWKGWGGGDGEKSGFTKTMKTLIDDMHHWYHRGGQRVAGTIDHLAAMHVYDSVVVFEKKKMMRPFHTEVGAKDA